jgi:hypothetical protein
MGLFIQTAQCYHTQEIKDTHKNRASSYPDDARDALVQSAQNSQEGNKDNGSKNQAQQKPEWFEAESEGLIRVISRVEYSRQHTLLERE